MSSYLATCNKLAVQEGDRLLQVLLCTCQAIEIHELTSKTISIAKKFKR